MEPLSSTWPSVNETPPCRIFFFANFWVQKKINISITYHFNEMIIKVNYIQKIKEISWLRKLMYNLYFKNSKGLTQKPAQ